LQKEIENLTNATTDCELQMHDKQQEKVNIFVNSAAKSDGDANEDEKLNQSQWKI
jgi:hypothetical protein